MTISQIAKTGFTVLICAMLLLPAGCTRENSEPKEAQPSASVVTTSDRRGGIYRRPLSGNPPTLDPAFVNDEYGVAVIQQLYDGLVQFGPYLMVLPALAETWQVEDGARTYRFKLRPGALFHNRQPVTAGDVIFSISRLLRTEPAPAIMPHLLKIEGAQSYKDRHSDHISGCQAVSASEVLVRLEEPHAPFLTALGMHQAKIVPQKEVQRLGTRFGQQPVGSGPFQFVSWEPDTSVHLKRFADYFGGEAYLDEIHYQIYTREQSQQMLNDFKKGLLEEIPIFGEVRQELAVLPELQWFRRPSLSLFFYGFNCRQKPLQHAGVRKALSMAVDRQKLVQSVYGGRFLAADTLLPPGMPGYDPDNKMVPGDLETARAELQAALGSEFDQQLTLEVVSAYQTPRVEKELAVIRDGWQQLGVDLKAKYIPDWDQFNRYIRSPEVQLYRYVWYADMPDADSFLHPLFASDSASNFMHYTDGEVDRLLMEARGTVDSLQRARIYRQAEARVLDASPLIPLFYLSLDRVYQARVQGVRVSALGGAALTRMHRVWLGDSPAP